MIWRPPFTENALRFLCGRGNGVYPIRLTLPAPSMTKVSAIVGWIALSKARMRIGFPRLLVIVNS